MFRAGDIYIPLSVWKLSEIKAVTTQLILLLFWAICILFTWPKVLTARGVLLTTLYFVMMFYFQRRLASGISLRFSSLHQWRRSKSNFRYSSSFVTSLWEKKFPLCPDNHQAYSGNRPVAVITGGERGIGYQVAKQLAFLGFDLALCCPAQPEAEKAIGRIKHAVTRSFRGGDAPPVTISFFHLNLGDEKSVRRCASQLLSTTARIDILLNNAGILHADREGRRVTNSRGDELILAVNFIGPSLFTELLLNTLKRSQPSRIVNVSSLMELSACIPPDYTPLTILMENCSPKPWITTSNYSLSKLLVVCYTRDLALRLKGTGVTVSCLHPGVVFTRIYDGLGVWAALMPLVLRTVFKFAGEGAEVVLHCALSDEIESGSFYADSTNFDSVVSPWAKDPKMNAKIRTWVLEHFQLCD